MYIALVLNSTPQSQRQSAQRQDVTGVRPGLKRTTTGRDQCTQPQHITNFAYESTCTSEHSDGARIQSHCTSTMHTLQSRGVVASHCSNKTDAAHTLPRGY